MLIGRENETKKLKELYNSDSAEFVAVYGRRRVGKTFLVEETFGNRITFRHAGLSPIDGVHRSRGRMKDQLLNFHRSLVLSGADNAKMPQSWLEAFYMLEDLLLKLDDGHSRQLVFIDEIQWMDTPKSGFMTGLEAFWNGWACHRHNVMLIVCGSSSSWVLDKLINNHGGLYGRLTHQLELKPFSLRECEEFFSAKGIVMSRYDIVQAYMAVGGIPYYLRYFEKTRSLPQNIQVIYFAENAPLRFEFDKLFASLFSNAEVMKSIIMALAERNAGLTREEILLKTGIANSGEFSGYLMTLISGGFIIKYCSFGSGKRDALYKLADPFCIFYLRFVSEGGKRRLGNWINASDQPSVISWRGFAFENVCFNHIRQIKAALGVSGVVTEESLWSKRGTEDSKGTQIDLLINRKDNVLNMCEIKFCSDLFAVDKEYHFTLIRRKELLREMIPKRASIHSTLITTYGVKYNEYSGDFISVVTLDDLFREV